jgi:hypothetical protein
VSENGLYVVYAPPHSLGPSGVLGQLRSPEGFDQEIDGGKHEERQDERRDEPPTTTVAKGC